MARKAPKRRPGSSRRASTKGRTKKSSGKRPAAGSRAAGRKGAGMRGAKAGRRAGRKTAAKRPKAKAGRKRTTSAAAKARTALSTRRRGGTGREETLAQTPETGRTVTGRTNPMPTRRSTGTGADAGTTRRAPGLERARRQLREIEETVPSPPSSLDPNRRRPSAARSGRKGLRDTVLEHHEVSPEITAGDVDANWEDAYSIGDEAPGGDNPTPDQDRVDDIGKALGVQYDDNEELKASDKIAARDRKRWELDPASSEDYVDRDRDNE
jgi:Family of unknown function (DUF6335)